MTVALLLCLVAHRVEYISFPLRNRLCKLFVVSFLGKTDPLISYSSMAVDISFV